MAQGPIRHRSGPNRRPTLATLLPATCSTKWRRGHHAAELVPPWLPPPPRLCLYLCGSGRAPEHSPHPLPLLQRFSTSPKPPLLSATGTMAMASIADAAVGFLAASTELCPHAGVSWSWRALAPQLAALAISRPNPGDPEHLPSIFCSVPCVRRKKDLVLKYETTQGSRCEPQTQMNSAFGLRLIREILRIPGAKSFSFILCFCRFLV